jgi:hypothetical protein
MIEERRHPGTRAVRFIKERRDVAPLRPRKRLKLP